MNEKFLEKAAMLDPKLYHREVSARSVIEIMKGKADYEAIKLGDADCLSAIEMKKGDRICLDFGQHCVGYFSFSIRAVGSHQDAPAHLKIKLGEQICEIAESFENYEGNISSSWLQEEYLFIDELPAMIKMPRRYAFRYIEIEVLDTSHKFRVIIENPKCDTVSSADRKSVPKRNCHDKELQEIDEIALNTLEGCMQEVFEDGPKRDRRVWIGDLRLQALANYYTFKNNDLVKRCLYLFAGAPMEEGQAGACLYIRPEVSADDIKLFDYSLFFISCLYDYYMETRDSDTLAELWDTAFHQVEIAAKALDENNIVRDQPDNWWWCFIDWNVDLNKQASAQAVFIYTMKQAYELAGILGDESRSGKLSNLIQDVSRAAIKYLWDDNQGFFVSGARRQVSWASQIWFALSGILPDIETKNLMEKLKEKNPSVKLMTPYMNHCYVEALLKAGLKSDAEDHIRRYWGGMVKAKADCFWEVYDPDNPDVSAYGDRIMNSYCHAWSCTPTYFIRKYFDM